MAISTKVTHTDRLYEAYEQSRQELDAAVLRRRRDWTEPESLEINVDSKWEEITIGNHHSRQRVIQQDGYILTMEFKISKGFYMAPHHHTPDNYLLEGVITKQGRTRYHLDDTDGTVKVVNVPAGHLQFISALRLHGFLALDDCHGYLIFVKEQRLYKRVWRFIRRLFFRKGGVQVKINTK